MYAVHEEIHNSEIYFITCTRVKYTLSYIINTCISDRVQDEMILLVGH